MKLAVGPSLKHVSSFKNVVTGSVVQCVPFTPVATLEAISCLDHISCLTWVTTNAILTMSADACSPCHA